MRTEQIKRVPGKYAKLTVTSERVTIRLPESLNQLDAQRIVAYFQYIASKHPNPDNSLRGDLTPERVFNSVFHLHTQSKDQNNTYTYNEYVLGR